MERLREGAAAMGIELGNVQIGQFQTYLEMLAEWNERAGLTSSSALDAAETRHFLDSLTVSLAMRCALSQGASFVDVGSGAGFPGVPLKIAFAASKATLVEATAKKAAFLEALRHRLGMSGLDVIAGRAETLARQPDLREGFDFAVVRAVAGVATLAELTLPFCRTGGRVVLQKGPDVGDDLERGRRAIAEMGGDVRDVMAVEVNGLERTATLVVLEKVRPTPDRYPRRPGMPEKRPVHG